ncbi:SDR family NAD(P)-dependent oxidoreductase [Aminobacter sp. MSH1]|uniref:SDR family NAD(P)-dependent oxidoreductase n=1 Tax=Aminobacter sp. MSH1 TaxID=374606 RepID=UPI000D386D31|nr:SDR family NAD(P)-dependent oxidoreductase [Aminobacter sp. MSH1]
MKNKTVVISGAGIGIGKATAEAFARDGYTVFVTDVLEDEGRSVVADIQSAGGAADFMRMDVSDTDEVDHVISAIEKKRGALDVVVANAGIAHRVPLEKMTDAKWDTTFDIDLKGVFRMARAAAPAMRARRSGVILALSSISGVTYGWSEHAHYSAAKAGVAGLVRGLASELGPHGIRVNGVAPGTIRTAQSLSEEHSLGPRGVEEQARNVPLGRVGEPDDVADVLLFLASNGARYITGHTILVDGGLTIRQG